MKKGIHPEYHKVTVTCTTCGSTFETGSTLIQLASKKFFHRKVFIAAPIHHHFELLGWKETKIVAVLRALESSGEIVIMRSGAEDEYIV